MESTAGLNDASTADIVMGILYALTAVVLIVTAYIIYTKQFQRKKMEAVESINFITAQYNIYKEKTQLLIESPSDIKVRLDLLDDKEELVSNLLDEVLERGEHIIIFDPQMYPQGQYYFNLKSDTTTILKKIKIS